MTRADDNDFQFEFGPTDREALLRLVSYARFEAGRQGCDTAAHLLAAAASALEESTHGFDYPPEPVRRPNRRVLS